jgi:uncharacterized protein YndB with AHSA1/START domain
MSVTNITKHPDTMTMFVTAEFDAPVERVWQVWADPRLLERWWGPPTYPATVVEHDLTPGGAVTYFMTGPEGDRHHGWWKVHTADQPRLLSFVDGFADDTGTPNPDMPTTETTVRLDDRPAGGTQMVIESVFPSLEAMEQMIAMGMEEGITAAIGQIDGLVVAEATTKGAVKT